MPKPLQIGSLCSGYAGLDLAVGQVFDIQHMWHAEIDPAASTVLDAHWPDVPNHGDLTAVNWSSVEPVDILTAGFPCQPVSAAVRRQGLNDERWLFDDIADAVGRMVTRPRLLVFENVAGLLTANGGHAMARVVHRLAALGYVGRYRSVRASDVGAAHRRERVFIVARLAADTASIGHRDTGPTGGEGVPAAALGSGAAADGVSLLPTPMVSDGNSPPVELTHPKYSQLRDRVLNLLPTPRTNDMHGPGTHGDGGSDLRTAVSLLPTPTAMHSARNATAGRSPDAKPFDLGWTLADIAYADRWGEYGAAIARWEHATGRPAPEPTETGTKGQPRLAPPFVEWLMGLPAGWVTDHLPRNPALRVLGNGVVPQQAAYAVADLAGVAS